jgi:hypothetical protein
VRERERRSEAACGSIRAPPISALEVQLLLRAVQILPGVLAMGEAAQRSGAEMLAALVLGDDVAGRLSSAFTRYPLAHGNGQATLLAAVAAGARLHGLDAAGVCLAMRIGATLLLTPSYTNALAGAPDQGIGENRSYVDADHSMYFCGSLAQLF